ncbi:MAG: TIGR04283 family arsenosugar biosynthesis glycosyltransferase, partial [Planctomycetota bacterium]
GSANELLIQDTSTRAPRFSVVVPTLEEAANLPELWAALRAQGEPFQGIVSDGESRDGTAALARELGAEVVRGPRGRGAQLARGAARARGELVLFLHADTRLAPGALTALARAFEDPALVASGMRQRIDHPARFYRLVERAADRRVRRGWVYGDSGLCVRREALVRVGGVPELALFEDLELSRRLRGLGKIALVSEAELVISARRWERDGRIRRTLANWGLTVLWFLGVPPAALARAYRPMG